jgi:hypothetical protein
MGALTAEFAALADTLADCGIAERGTVRTVRALHQRSLCYRVDLVDGDSLFVKTARRTATGEWSADVAAEGRRLQGLSARLPDHDFFPQPRHLDDERRMLVTTCYPDHSHLDAATDPDGFARRHLRALGMSLAATHSVRRPAGHDADPESAGDLRIPDADCARTLIDSLLRPTPTAVASFPAGYSEVLIAIRTRGLAVPLGGLADAFRREVLIHGDLKSNNILCAAPDSVRLIDWETAGWGDPRWDVGAVIGDAIFGWLTGISFAGPGGLADWLAGARRPITDVRDDLAAFRQGYLDGGAGDPTADPADRAVCLGFAAAFLLQRTMASALHSPVLSPLALAALHLARQLLTRPDDLSEVLL